MLCPACLGRGQVLRTPGKRARFAARKTGATAPLRRDACAACHGHGAYPSARGTLPDAGGPGAQASTSVAIVGAGIGGAALACALHSRGIEAMLFERDCRFDDRRQGYGFTLQQGAAALRQLGIEPVGISSTAHYSFDPQGAVLGCYGRGLHAAGEAAEAKRKRHNLQLPRQELRRLLLDHCAVPVQWGRTLEAYEEDAGGVTLRFSDSATVRAAVLVAADGIRSSVRRVKIGDQLKYLGLVVVLGIAAYEHPLLAGRVVQTLDGETRLYTMPFARGGDHESDSTMWQLSFPVSEAEARRLGGDAAMLKAEALRRCGGWHTPLPALLAATPEESISGYPVYDREVLTVEKCRGAAESRVTLIGDAAHPMSPFKGQGANQVRFLAAVASTCPLREPHAGAQALLDAVSLARALYDSELGAGGRGTAGGLTPPRLPVAEALAAYEAEMLPRSAAKVLASYEAARVLHSSAALAATNCTRAAAAVARERNGGVRSALSDAEFEAAKELAARLAEG